MTPGISELSERNDDGGINPDNLSRPVKDFFQFKYITLFA